MIVDSATCMEIANGTDSKEYMNYSFSNLVKLKKNRSYVVSSSFDQECTSSKTDNESKLCMFCGVDSKQKRKDPNRITTYVGNPGMISFNEEDKKVVC